MTTDPGADGPAPEAPAGVGRRLALRAGTLVALGLAVALLVDRLGGEQSAADADAPLTALWAALLVGVVWAFRDGRRGPAPAAVVLWSAVCLLAVLVPQGVALLGALFSPAARSGVLAAPPGELALGALVGVAAAFTLTVPVVLAVLAGAATVRRRG